MSRKEEYKLQNEQFLEQLRTAEGIKELPCGILYRVLEAFREILKWSGFKIVKTIERGGTKKHPELTEKDMRNCKKAVHKLL